MERTPVVVCRIELLIGPMFAGKSTEMIRRIQRHQVAHRRTIVLKWNRDVRSKERSYFLMTHSDIRVPCVRVGEELMSSLTFVQDYDVIGIDDGQFFPDLVEFCETVVNKLQKIVIVAALDSDFRREPFENVCRLVAKAEKVKKMLAICTSCGRDAPYSFKFLDASPGSEVIDVGGTEKYTSLCRPCYFIESQRTDVDE